MKTDNNDNDDNDDGKEGNDFEREDRRKEIHLSQKNESPEYSN